MGLLDKVLQVDRSGDLYCRASNSDSKVWLLPRAQIQTALSIYQPSSFKGKAFKVFLPTIVWSQSLSSAARVSMDPRTLDAPIKDLVESLFGTKCLVAGFGGTPSAHQKVTLQIYAGERIYGYVKVSDSVEIARLFSREATLLDYLAGLGVQRIPEVLYEGPVGGMWCFCQSNVKQRGYRSPNRMVRQHWEFLDDLVTRSQRTVLFEETDIYGTLLDLAGHIPRLNKHHARVVSHAMDDLMSRWKGRVGTFAAYHGDFTPWNTVLNPDGLWSFDFEYGMKLYPPYLDAIHFLIQSKLFQVRNDVAHIDQCIFELLRLLEKRTDVAPDELLRFYLLSVIDLYLGRNTELSAQEQRNLSIRIQLLERSL